jgi:hypothetical protein
VRWRAAAIGLATVLLVACSGPDRYVGPTSVQIGKQLEREGLCDHPRRNVHRRREVLCAPRPDGGRTGIATFASHRGALRSIDLTRRAIRTIGCDLHAPSGELTVVVGRRFTVVGSDRPAAVARLLDADVHEAEPERPCREPDTAVTE